LSGAAAAFTALLFAPKNLVEELRSDLKERSTIYEENKAMEKVNELAD